MFKCHLYYVIQAILFPMNFPCNSPSILCSRDAKRMEIDSHRIRVDGERKERRESEFKAGYL